MEYPTFGPADAPLALRVQSLDRKGDFKDKNKVLKVTPCRRTRSIANLKFFEAPTPKKAAPPPPVPPMPTFVAPTPAPRPPPRFLELFNPPDMNDVPAATHSGASTPFSEESRSQPATPPSPRVHLMPSNSRLARSYFAYMPHVKQQHQQPIDGLPFTMPDRELTPVAGKPSNQWDHSNSEDEDNDEDDDEESDYGTVQLDRLRQDWSSHAAAQRGLGMTGTFGRA